MALHPVASLDALWEGEMLGVVVEGKAVLLIHLDETIYAYQDRCQHLAVPLRDGKLIDGRLICTAHEWEYDARSGHGLNPVCVQLERYAVEVKDGQIWVDVQHLLEQGRRQVP